MSRGIRMYTVCQSLSILYVIPLFATKGPLSFNDGRVHSENLGMKGLKGGEGWGGAEGEFPHIN